MSFSLNVRGKERSVLAKGSRPAAIATLALVFFFCL